MKKRTITSFVICTCILAVLLILSARIWTNSRSSRIESSDEPRSSDMSIFIGVSSTKAGVKLVGETENHFVVPRKSERLRMLTSERIALLEKLGKVPDDPDITDFWLAEETSWWGKRLDPKDFWKNRPVWYDASAEFEARRRGRGYPPMPYEDQLVADRSDVDKIGDGISVEGRDPRYVSSSRENAFWDKFMKTHPQAPDSIQRWQEDKANKYMRHKYFLEFKPEEAIKYRSSHKKLAGDLESAKKDAEIFWYPPESISSEAYFWTHVLHKRREYELFLQTPNAEYEREVSSFFSQVYVDKKLITEPLTADDMKAANAWKVAYLRRLRTDKWDDSYINAYLQAWNLKETEIFDDGNAVISR